MNRWVVCHPVTNDASLIQQLLGYGVGVGGVLPVLGGGFRGCITCSWWWFWGVSLVRSSTHFDPNCYKVLTRQTDPCFPRPSHLQTTGTPTQAGSLPVQQQIIIQPPPPKQVKNKSLLCKPFVQTKATSCRPHTQTKECQTGKWGEWMQQWIQQERSCDLGLDGLCKTERTIFHRSHILCVCVCVRSSTSDSTLCINICKQKRKTSVLFVHEFINRNTRPLY